MLLLDDVVNHKPAAGQFVACLKTSLFTVRALCQDLPVHTAVDPVSLSGSLGHGTGSEKNTRKIKNHSCSLETSLLFLPGAFAFFPAFSVDFGATFPFAVAFLLACAFPFAFALPLALGFACGATSLALGLAFAFGSAFFARALAAHFAMGFFESFS